MQSYAVNTPNIGDIPGVGGLSEQDGSNTENVNDADQTEDPPKLLPRPIPRPTGPPPNIDDGKNADQIQNPPKLVPRPTRPPLNTESKHTESGPSHREKWSTTEPNTDGIVEPVVLIPIPRPRPRPMFSPNTEDENTEDETSSQLKESNVDSNGNNEAKDDTVNTEGKPKSWLRTKPTHENLEDGSSNPRLPEANINDDLGVDEQEDYDSPIEKPFPHRPPSHGSENGEDESDYQRTVSNTDIGSEDSEGKGTSDRPKPRPRPWVPSGPLSDNDKHNEQDAEAESEIDESAKTVLEPQRQPGPVKENTEGESSGEESVAGINGNKQDKDNTVFRPKPRPGVAQRPDSDSGVADILNGMHKTGTKIFEHVKRADQSSFGTGEEQNEGSRVENERGADARWMFAKLSPDFGDKSTMLRKMPENMAKRRISNDGFARCFPPKLKRITRNAIDTIVQSFPDQRRKDLLRKMLPKENAEDSQDQGFNFTSLPESHVRKLVEDIAKLPKDLQDKLITTGRLEEIDVADIYSMFPTNIVPAFTKKKFDEISSMSEEKISALCDRLLMRSCTPGNLQAAADGGINCLDRLRTPKKVLNKSQRLVLMDTIRTYNISTLIDPEFLISLFTSLGSALSPSDIQSLPAQLLEESLVNITSTILPFKSQRRALLKKVEKEYGSPDAWSDDVMEKIGTLVDDMDLTEISQLRKDSIRKAAGMLRFKMKMAEKRFAVSKLIASTRNMLNDSMDVESIKSGFQWLKSDRWYLDNVDISNLLKALDETRHLTQDMRSGEISLLASRLTNTSELLDVITITSDQLDSFGELLDGFDVSFFKELSEEALHTSTVLSRVTFASKAKARAILKRVQKGNRLGNLLNGMILDDIEHLDPASVFEGVTTMGRAKFDQSQTHQIMSKLRQHFNGITPKPVCFWSQMHGLQDMMRHIPTWQVLEEELIMPPPTQISGDPDCRCKRCENGLTKPQLYAAFEMVREKVNAQGAKDLDYSAEFFEKIGRLVVGMTAEDIRKIPEDTEFPTIVELLSDYEDDMDLSQVDALVGKLRSYFDMDNRQLLDEVTTITVSQIGRFLQYLDIGKDLTKFPEGVRMDIAKEIGISRMNKISLEKRNQLFKFALKNMGHQAVTQCVVSTESMSLIRHGTEQLNVLKYSRSLCEKRADGSTGVDLTRDEQLDETTIQDIGYLRCGVTEEEIYKLTAKAIDENIEEMQTCPFKVQQAKALAKRAIHYKKNRLQRRELLVGIGGFLPYISETELESIDSKELAAVSEYITENLVKQEKEIEAREKNGFIEEWSTKDKEENNEGKTRLLLKLRSALELASHLGSGK